MASGINEQIQERLVDLSTGQLDWITSWRLRREIARSAAIAEEWTAVRRLRADLDRYVREHPVPGVVVRSKTFRRGATVTFGGITMKRRTFVTTYAVLLLTVTGAVAARRHLSDAPWMTQGAGVTTAQDSRPFRCTFSMGFVGGGDDKDWRLSGNFKGRVMVYDESGRPWYNEPFRGTDADAPLDVRFRRERLPNWPRNIAIDEQPYDFVRRLTTLGRHEIRDDGGRLVGYVELMPWREAEQRQVDEETSSRAQAEEDFYRSPERLAPCFSRRAAEDTERGLGVVAGRLPEIGVSWKVYGYVRVKARYLTPGKPTLQEARSAFFLDPSKEAQMSSEGRERYQKMRALAPKLGTDPVIHWAVAGGEKAKGWGQESFDPPPGDGYATQRVPARGGYLVDTTGRWRQVRFFGSFCGYGRHEVRDGDGRMLLVLDVAPLTPPAGAR